MYFILFFSCLFFKTYFVTITAESSAGSVNVTSDGVTVVQENAILNNVTVYDGEPCVEAGLCERLINCPMCS